MADSGIHSIVISVIKLFNGNDIQGNLGVPVSESLFGVVDSQREFDSQRVEIVTKGKDHFSFSGKVFELIPGFDEIISFEDFEKSLNQSKENENFNFHAAVRLSVTYPFSELSEFLEEAEEEGIENPNLFTWIQYCVDDATEVLGEDIRSTQDLKPLLTIRGI
jgi:hypothetical protein